MKPEDAAARAAALCEIAVKLDDYVFSAVTLTYDAASGVIGVAHDIRQAAIALSGAVGAAEIYLRSADRVVRGLTEDYPSNVGANEEVARALEEVSRTLSALRPVTDYAGPERRGR